MIDPFRNQAPPKRSRPPGKEQPPARLGAARRLSAILRNLLNLLLPPSELFARILLLRSAFEFFGIQSSALRREQPPTHLRGIREAQW
jgi:hypothetical protein